MASNQEKYSANSVIAGLNRESVLDAQRKDEAAAAGVSSARFIDYAEVLENYEGRSDTEHLADRRARFYAATAAEQDFARAADYDGNSGETADSATEGGTGPEESSSSGA